MILSSRTSPHDNIFTCYTVDKIDKILWLSRLWIRIWKQTRYFQSRRPAAYLNTASVPGGIAGTLLFFTMIFVLSFISLSTIICPDLLLMLLDLRRRYHTTATTHHNNHNLNSNHRNLAQLLYRSGVYDMSLRNCLLESIHLVPPT